MAAALSLVDVLISTIDKAKDESKDDEEFKSTDLTQNMQWLNEPSDKSCIDIKSGSLTFECDIETDFWITPDLNRHSGHFYYMDTVKGNFVAYVQIFGAYNVIYDQMGLMVIRDKNNWVKTGIEFIDQQHVSTVVTKQYSDWNVAPINRNPESIQLKLIRSKAKVIIQYKLPYENKWFLLRKFQFFDDELQVGLMACSPQRKSNNDRFKPRFKNFSLTLLDDDINDPVPD